jgi:amino acid transporter
MNDRQGLRANTLSFPEVLATSVALIGLTMTPALVAPGTFAYAGNGSWLAYVFGAVMLFFVALNLNQFAKRSSSAGSMYGYVTANLGGRTGAIAGWTLIWAYVFVGASQFGAMTVFVQNLAGSFGINVPELAIFALLAAALWTLAYRDIQVSAIVMLILESISVAIICIILGLILVKHGTRIDQAQLHLQGVQSTGIGLGIATTIFSFVGFESATAFGEEARNPLITIPRAVVGSVIIAGLFFVVTLYAEVLGLRGSGTTLDKLSMPLWSLADLYHVPLFKIPLALGAICSSFSVGLACVTTCARIVLPMGRKGLLPSRVTAISPRFATPHVATALSLIAMIVVGASMYAARVDAITIFNYCGVLSAFGFILIYALIAVAAPRYLHSIGDHRPQDYVLAAVALIFLIIPAVTLFYPVPPPPGNWFAYIFVAYLLVGWLYLRKSARGAADADPVVG